MHLNAVLGETRDSNVQHSCSGYKNIVYHLYHVGTFIESSHRQDCFWTLLRSHLSLILVIIVLGRAVPSQPLLVELKIK